jgi:type II secretory pathway pseudopilin PulG
VVPTEEHLPKKRRSSFTPITISSSSSSNQYHGARRLSGGMSSPRSTEEWEVVRMKWLARRDMQSAQSLEQQGPFPTSGQPVSTGGDTPQTPAALSTTAQSVIFDISPGSRIDPAPVSLLTSRVKSALSPEPPRPTSLPTEQGNHDPRSLSPPPRLPFASAQLGVMPNDDRGPATWVLKPKTANTPSRSNSPQPPSVKIPPKNRYQRDASVSRRSGTPGEGDNEAKGANDRYHFQEWSERHERELSETLRRMGVQDRQEPEEG